MANVKNGNSLYVDAASTNASTSIYNANGGTRSVRLLGVVFTPGAAGDAMTLNDVNTTGPAAGDAKLKVGGTAAGDTRFFDFSDCPIRFNTGVWVSAITAGAIATIIVEYPSG